MKTQTPLNIVRTPLSLLGITLALIMIAPDAQATELSISLNCGRAACQGTYSYCVGHPANPMAYTKGSFSCGRSKSCSFSASAAGLKGIDDVYLMVHGDAAKGTARTKGQLLEIDGKQASLSQSISLKSSFDGPYCEDESAKQWARNANRMMATWDAAKPAYSRASWHESKDVKIIKIDQAIIIDDLTPIWDLLAYLNHPYQKVDPYTKSPRCLHCHAMSSPGKFPSLFHDSGALTAQDGLVENLPRRHVEENRWASAVLLDVENDLGWPDSLLNNTSADDNYSDDGDDPSQTYLDFIQTRAADGTICFYCHNTETFNTGRTDGASILAAEEADAIPLDPCEDAPGVCSSGQGYCSDGKECKKDEWFAPALSFNWTNKTVSTTCRMILHNLGVLDKDNIDDNHPEEIEHLREHMTVDGRVVWSIRQLPLPGIFMRNTTCTDTPSFGSRASGLAGGPAIITARISQSISIWNVGEQEGYTNSLDPCRWYSRINAWVDHMLENQDNPSTWCP